MKRHWEDKRWRNIRKAKLLENPVCEHCNRAKAVHVHHIVKPALGGDPVGWTNLLSLCYECHAIETARFRKLYGRS